MKHWISVVIAMGVPAAGAAADMLAPSERAAAFAAAGFKSVGGQWQGCGDPGTAAYRPGAIESVRDIDGDGRPEAIVTEESSYCYGADGTGFTLVSKQADGRWRVMIASAGVPTLLASRGTAGWPDIEVGGPGFCFPVLRWNGREYAPLRHQYAGKPCRPG